ncbi:cupin domain-containing protein [Xylophilus rhododendri]|uniref:Cupin domain-containing protein n=1 Tax=Xylophilus rhododendri TaxID=2697032 RepID=A0A857J0A2_9BURK|nr:cupin domain-containing protein [Xylophilus rhododendri]QHI97294.1 cupin domain-containing protein [Xylophilus rhododendri]
MTDISTPLALLGGLSAQTFMQRHWQRKPLLVRQAFDAEALKATPSRAQLFALAADEDVESRLIRQDGGDWQMRHGPVARRALPALNQPGWTLLVQGVDLHDDAAHRLLSRFRFLPDARLDDLMVSYASDGGGVGPHFDSYDVFLLQTSGQRRWRIGRQKNLELQEGMPLKILADFQPEQEYLLEPGDMLYLPPRYAHEGVAVGGDCITCSIGFRAPRQDELAQEMLQRLAEDAVDEDAPGKLYGDAGAAASGQPAAMPQALVDFAATAVERLLKDRDALPRAMGEYLTEPKANVWFDEIEGFDEEEDDIPLTRLRLDRRTRMLYDERHIFINGESYRAAGRDARLMRQLADKRLLDDAALAGASEDARELLRSWCIAGWAHND